MFANRVWIYRLRRARIRSRVLCSFDLLSLARILNLYRSPIVFCCSLISGRVLRILFAPFGDKERSNQRIEPVGHFGLSNLFRSGAVTRSPFTLSLLITQHTSSQPIDRWNAHRLSFLTEPVRDNFRCLPNLIIKMIRSTKAQGHIYNKAESHSSISVGRWVVAFGRSRRTCCIPPHARRNRGPNYRWTAPSRFTGFASHLFSRPKCAKRAPKHIFIILVQN